MHRKVFLPLALAGLGMGGCATQWQHSSITDPALAAKRLAADERYCELVAYGGAPMPQIPAPPASTIVSGQVRTYNPSTGETTYGTYSGQATSIPSGGFAGGFASGMANGVALGAAFEAARTQKLLRKECMAAKGWVEAPDGGSPAAPVTMAVRDTVPTGQTSPESTAESKENAGVLTCRVGSAHATPEDPGEQFDFQMKIAGAHVWHGVFKREIPLTTTEEEYRWKVNLRDISPTAGNFIVIGAINRYSGAFREVLEKEKGIVPWSKGVCRKVERAL